MRVRFFPGVLELVPKWSKGMVCKTIIRGFKSHPVLFYMWTLAERFNALDCGTRVHQFESGTPTFFWSNGRVVDCGSLLGCYSSNAIKSSNLFYSVFWLIRITVSSLGFHPSKTGSTPRINLIWRISTMVNAADC